MKQDHSSLRPGMTALVAVLALNATPLLAQDAAPAAEAPPATVAPAPPAASAAVAPQASAPVDGNQLFPQIRVNMDDAPVVAEEAAAPAAAAAARSATTERAPAATPRAAAPAPRSSEPSVTPAATPAAVPPVVAAAPIAPEPTVPMAGEQPAAPAVADAAQPSPASYVEADYAVAGAAGLGVLALVGGSFVLMRRRRRNEDWLAEDEAIEDAYVTAEPVRAETPVAAPTPMPAMASAAAPMMAQTRRPMRAEAGEMGQHVAAAYEGPTEDNPSLSLKKRLKRARALDQRARIMAEQGMTPQAAAPAMHASAARAKPAPQPSMTQWGYTQPTPAAGNRPHQNGFRPAYQ